jgi:hypothetical protein
MTNITTPTVITDWDDAYANAAHIPNAASWPPRWAARAASWRSELLAESRAQLNVPYAAHVREAYDLFMPVGEPHGLAVFVHGGYWLRFGRSDWSHLARGAVDHGFAVAIPGYPLCPEVSIARITGSISTAVCQLASRIDGPIMLCGHSAGGHLVSRMLCSDANLPANVAERLGRVLSISGVHDLLPLMKTHMNESLNLTLQSAIDASPARQIPRPGSRVGAWVGANERPEFIRQTELLATLWHGLGAEVTIMIEPERHHFNVIDALELADSTMLGWWLGGQKAGS